MLHYWLPDPNLDVPEEFPEFDWHRYSWLVKSILSSDKSKKEVMSLNYTPQVLPEKWDIFPYWAFRLNKAITWDKPTKINIMLNGRRLRISNFLSLKILEAMKSDRFMAMDCINFTKFITSRENIGQSDLAEVWESLDILSLKIGDVVAFLNDEWKINNYWPNGLRFHFVTYIGSGLFVFKLGSMSNEIFFSNFENLKKWFLPIYPKIYRVL